MTILCFEKTTTKDAVAKGTYSILYCIIKNIMYNL